MKHKIEVLVSGLSKGQTPASAAAAAVEQNAGSRGRYSNMWYTAIGVIVGVVLSPYLKQFGRPVARGVVKAGLRAGRGVQGLTASVKEDLQDLAAEARQEMSSETPPAPPR